MAILQAVYFDGKRSRRHPVSMIIGGGTLKIVGREVNETFDTRGVHRSLRVANTPRWLYLPGGGACVTADNDAVDRMTRGRRYERVLHLWESRPALAALSVALVALLAWLLVDRGVPRAVDAIASRIPVQTETALGEKTLAGLDQQFLKPSQLPAARQQALRTKFASMVRTAGATTPYRLEFRASPIVGPNAFALPAGIIVMTDELVRTSNHDLEVLGVLAHELGHVHHRHTLRRLLESSATALIIASLTGDVASATALAAAAPALLLQNKYSRDNEREADRYAIDMMQKAQHNPGHLAAILVRMSAKDARRGALPTFLASHPPTEEREALARAGVPPLPPSDTTQAGAEDTQTALVAEKPKRKATDPVHREIAALIEQRDFAGLERVLGGFQTAFEADAGASRKLQTAYEAFDRIPRSALGTLDEWCKSHPASYAAHMARAALFYYQGLDARGTAYIGKTAEENLRTMRHFFEKAQADLERSLTLTPKPYLSRLTLMAVARIGGSRRDENAHYREAVKLAPQSIELRLDHMATLEPRWGGSYKAMQAYADESRVQLTDAKAADRLAARIPAYRAWEYKQNKDLSRSLTLYNEALALYESANTLCERANVQSQLNREIEAMADVNVALAKPPVSDWCLENAVWVARRASNADEAIAVLNQVIALNAYQADAYAQRGWRYQQQKKLELAFQDYLAAARLGEAWAELMTGKYLWSGWGVKQDRDEALVWLRKAAAKGHPDAKLSLKQALEQLAQK